ncbi:MAG TPA: hypothetical protein VFO16_07155 [Pseudonocardiaceae bacterium]|nr:hypothetical protein [Pseudonocardiaceae bacterium]
MSRFGPVRDRRTVRGVLGVGLGGGSALARRARSWSVVPVGAGLALVGVSAYAFLALAGHALAPGDYAAVASLYLLTAVVGPGVFAALEQETSREVSARIAAGHPTAPVLRSAIVISAVLAAAMITLLLVLSPLLVRRVFAGAWPLLLAAIVAVAGAASVSVIRGLFSGQRRYGWYGTSLAAEGLARLLPSVALAWGGVASAGLIGAGHSPAAFGFAFAMGTPLAAAATAAGVRPDVPGPAADLGRMARGVGFLAGASALTFLLANIAPVVLTSRLTGDPDTAASFISLFVLARLPLFMFSPVQAFLLPALTAAAERGEAAQMRRQIRTMAVLVGAIGLAGVAGTAIAGPWAARVFFNAPLELSALVAAALGLSTMIMILAQVLQPALVALGEHRVAASAWIAGTAVFGALLILPVTPLVAVVAAQLAGPAMVVVIMTRALLTRIAIK